MQINKIPAVHIKEIQKNTYGECDWGVDLSGNLYADVHAMILTKEEHNRIVNAQASVVRVLQRTLEVLRLKPDLNEWLGISEDLVRLSKYEIESLTTYGRFDWMLEENGELSVLEFNSETPMGWMEAGVYTSKLYEEHKKIVNCTNPSSNLFKMLEDSIRKTLTRYNNFGRVAIVGDLGDEEEDDTFHLLKSITEKVVDDVVICGVENLKVYKGFEGIKDGLYADIDDTLYPIDILQTFYSIEWLTEDEGGKDLLQLLESGEVKLMNPISTLQLHSKGLWALIWFLYNTEDVYSESECEAIENFIPYSTFDLEDLDYYHIEKYMEKPLHHREGNGINYKRMGESLSFDIDYVYQEQVNTIKFYYEREVDDIRTNKKVSPTIGVYCIDNQFGGYMTRLSEGICSSEDSTFIATFVEE